MIKTYFKHQTTNPQKKRAYGRENAPCGDCRRETRGKKPYNKGLTYHGVKRAISRLQAISNILSRCPYWKNGGFCCHKDNDYYFRFNIVSRKGHALPQKRCLPSCCPFAKFVTTKRLKETYLNKNRHR